MVHVCTSPSAAITRSICVEYARMASVEELDSSLSMLSNYSANSCSSTSISNNSSKRSSTVNQSPSPTTTVTTTTTRIPYSSALSLDSLLQISLITPPTSPDDCTNAQHRWTTDSNSSPVSPYSSNTSTVTLQAMSLLAESNNSDESNSANSCQLAVSNISQAIRAAAGAQCSGPNVVAIDNKIEQAMDLVKTHLTFAVREEVEILRSTIVDLETKVAQLESQNQVLKQFAPAEVVQSLAMRVQQQQQQKQLQQLQQPSSAPAIAVSSQPTIVSAAPQQTVAASQTSAVPTTEHATMSSASAPVLAEQQQSEQSTAAAEVASKKVDFTVNL